jgi:hypothetical protein
MGEQFQIPNEPTPVAGTPASQRRIEIQEVLAAGGDIQLDPGFTFDIPVISGSLYVENRARAAFVYGGEVYVQNGGTVGIVDISNPEAGMVYINVGGTIDNVIKGTVAGYGGTITNVYGGNVNVPAGATVINVYGGTVDVEGGTVTNVYGGTVHIYGGGVTNVYGGTVHVHLGGKVAHVYDGTIHVSGGTVRGVIGGTIRAHVGVIYLAVGYANAIEAEYEYLMGLSEEDLSITGPT